MKTFSKIYIFFLLLLMYIPILVMIVFSFTSSTVFGRWTGFSLELYANLFSGAEPQITKAIVTTFAVLLCVVALSVLLGTTAALGYHYVKSNFLRRSVNAASTISIATPDIVSAVSLFTLYVSFGVSRGTLTVILSQTAICVPFVFMCVLPILQKMDDQVYEASADLGASLWMTLRSAILPQLKPGILSGALIASVFSLDDFAVTLFARNNDGFETLSTLIYTDARKGALSPEFRALFSIIFIVFFLIMIFSGKRSKR